MGKYIGFIICLISGFILLALAMVHSGLYCSVNDGECAMLSKVSMLNYKISEDNFRIENIDKIYCDKLYYPSRKGKKAYYVLKISRNDNPIEYNLGSFQKIPMCRQSVENIKKVVFANDNGELNYFSPFGAPNVIGILLSVLMFVVAFIVITSKEEHQTSKWDDEET